jgi:hypothetical protein
MAQVLKAVDRLAEGAERLARVARAVKDAQFRRTKAKIPLPVDEGLGQSPDEVWARKYTTHCIGPVCYGPVADLLPFADFDAPLAESPRASDFHPPPAGTVEPGKRPVSGPIGLAIGKPRRRRTWFVRLLRRP